VEELSDRQPDHCKPKNAAHSRRIREIRKAYTTTYGSKQLSLFKKETEANTLQQKE
jgi:hypothetical protein